MALVQVYYSNVVSPWLYDIRRGFVERPKPAAGYTTVNAYYHTWARAAGSRPNGSPVINAYEQTFMTNFGQPGVDASFRVAASKFKNFIHQNDARAELGINVVQWRQALDMFSKRTRTLASFASLIPGAALAVTGASWFKRRQALNQLSRRLRVSNAPEMRRLHRRSAREWRRRIRTPGDLFLEFWFGWSPLVNDMYSAIDVLQQPVKPGGVTVRAFGSKSIKGFTQTFASPTNYVKNTITGSASAGIFSSVTIDNPNLYLANRLGLVNPVAIVWDAVPFSWLVNWFTNANEVVNHLTWDAGCSFPNNTRGHGYRVSYTVRRELRLPGVKTIFYGHSSVMRKERRKGFPPELTGWPTPRVNAPIGSFTRALTAGSLLLQHISKL